MCFFFLLGGWHSASSVSLLLANRGLVVSSCDFALLFPSCCPTIIPTLHNREGRCLGAPGHRSTGFLAPPEHGYSFLSAPLVRVPTNPVRYELYPPGYIISNHLLTEKVRLDRSQTILFQPSATPPPQLRSFPFFLGFSGRAVGDCCGSFIKPGGPVDPNGAFSSSIGQPGSPVLTHTALSMSIPPPSLFSGSLRPGIFTCFHVARHKRPQTTTNPAPLVLNTAGQILLVQPKCHFNG